MSDPSRAPTLVIALVAALTWAPGAPAADVSRAEFFAETKAYLPPFGLPAGTPVPVALEAVA